MTTPNLQLPEVPEAILTASDELNEGFLTVDAVLQLAVVSRLVTAPPANAVQGQRWIIPPGATGIWVSRTNHIGYMGPNGWQIIVPRPGWIAWSLEDEGLYIYRDGAWDVFSAGGGSLTVTDLDDSEIIPGVTDIQFEDADVTANTDGSVVVKVSPLIAKGDLYTRSATSKARLAVGADSSFLQADSSQATGLRWVAAGTPTVGEAASAARCYKNATQSIPDAILTALTWPVEDFDTDVYHSTSSNTSRFTAAIAGKYVVGCSIKWDSNTTGVRELYVVINGVTGTRKAGVMAPASAGLVQHVAETIDLAAGGYVEFYVNQNSGGARDVTNSEQITSAFLVRVGVTAAPTQLRGATWVRPAGAIDAGTTNEVQVRCPVNGTISGWSIGTLGGSGACVIDVRKSNQANYPPDSGDTICGGNKPSISANIVAIDSTLTSWTTSVTAGDWLTFVLESSANFRAIFFALQIKETQ